MLTNTNDAVRSTILRSLARKRRQAPHGFGEVDDQCDLLALGLIDSEDLVDLILEVEEECKCEFNPEAIDTANGLTLRSLISAFAANT
jgi:acyl carrier protein